MSAVRCFVGLLLLEAAVGVPTSFLNMVLDSKAELSAAQHSAAQHSPLNPSPSPAPKLWVLLVAGSSGYMNYRHQADVCHAYQVMHANGIADEQMVVMLYDDVAHSFFNTKKGSLYNEPNGPDVYAGVPIDYKGRHVNPKNFLAVLRGDAEVVRGQGTGRVIASTENDKVFVFFADHGAPGLIAFPSRFVVLHRYLFAPKLLSTLEEMHEDKKYSTMVLYIEACESGSMFNGLLPKDTGVLAVTAATPFESSFACYYDNVLGTFLGDCFSNHWLEHEDQTKPSIEARESIQDQVSEVRKATNTSHVCVYGDTSLLNHKAADYMGSRTTRAASGAEEALDHGVVRHHGAPASSRDVAVEVLRRQLQWAEAEGLKSGAFNSSGVELLRNRLAEEVATNSQADAMFQTIADHLAQGVEHQYHKIWHVQDQVKNCYGKKIEDFKCLEESIYNFEQVCGVLTDYSLKYVGVLQRACDQGFSAEQLTNAFSVACGSAPQPRSPSSHLAQEAVGCSGLASESDCMKNPKCTWCKCAAVPSKCYTRKAAKRLPPSIFTCDA